MAKPSSIKNYKSESNSQSIIVASFGTFSTGIDLKNVNHINLSESIKSEIILSQAIGRGMRKLAEKNKVMVWDLVDQLDGYSIKHGKIREDIYKEQKFPINHRLIDLTKKRPTE
jgi:type I site-specific restriction endonuclease